VPNGKQSFHECIYALNKIIIVYIIYQAFLAFRHIFRNIRIDYNSNIYIRWV